MNSTQDLVCSGLPSCTMCLGDVFRAMKAQNKRAVAANKKMQSWIEGSKGFGLIPCIDPFCKVYGCRS